MPVLVSCKFDEDWIHSANWEKMEQQSDQGLLCLPFCLRRLDSLLYGRAT